MASRRRGGGGGHSASSSSSTSTVLLDDVTPMTSTRLSLSASSEMPGKTTYVEESKTETKSPRETAPHPKPSMFVLLFTYGIYAMLFVYGYICDFFSMIMFWRRQHIYKPPKGYAPLLRDFEDFYKRHLYHRIQDCWNRPICSAPGARISVMLRESHDGNRTFHPSGKVEENCINLASYNYLGFAETRGQCIEDVCKSLRSYSISTCGAARDLGYTDLHRELEDVVARFVGKEDAMLIGMGFATNSTVLPALVTKGTLIISDSLNHASLVVGARGGVAKIRVFKHNDMKDLERILRDSIVKGQPRTHRPWEKILIVVEGIYSMEGEILNLPGVVELKKKYNCYLYVDEAHSIGALGPHGKGVCDYYGVDPNDVDILMGTFTKSFGAVGGYIASNREVIDHLRCCSFGTTYACNMTPGCAQMILSAFRCIQGLANAEFGPERIERLRMNSNYFRYRLMEMGFMVIGDEDSPIIPVLLYIPSLMPSVSRECLKQKLAVVVVGFPATPLIESRVRFCISAAHTKEMMDEALQKLDRIGDICMVKFEKENLKAREYARAKLKALNYR